MAGGWPPKGVGGNGTRVLSDRRRRLRCGLVPAGGWSCRVYVPDPKGSYSRRRRGPTMAVMQVIASSRAAPGRPSRFQVVSAFSLGAILVAAALTLLYIAFIAGLLDQFTPPGRPTTFEAVSGALAWAFPLTAPAGAGLLGLLRL